MKNEMKLLDVVALTEDLGDGVLHRGHVGTIVEILAEGVFEVEFVDDEGRTYAIEELTAKQLLPLCYKVHKAA